MSTSLDPGTRATIFYICPSVYIRHTVREIPGTYILKRGRRHRFTQIIYVFTFYNLNIEMLRQPRSISRTYCTPYPGQKTNSGREAAKWCLCPCWDKSVDPLHLCTVLFCIWVPQSQLLVLSMSPKCDLALCPVLWRVLTQSPNVPTLTAISSQYVVGFVAAEESQPQGSCLGSDWPYHSAP